MGTVNEEEGQVVRNSKLRGEFGHLCVAFGRYVLPYPLMDEAITILAVDFSLMGFPARAIRKTTPGGED